MNTDAIAPERTPKIPVITEELMLGDASRWRRFGDVVPAGGSLNDDGSTDYGLFGPGSVTWQVLLHPASIVFETAAQGAVQFLYKPITAGIRDLDPISARLDRADSPCSTSSSGSSATRACMRRCGSATRPRRPTWPRIFTASTAT